MWHTSNGDRTLEGAEADLIKAAVCDLTGSLRDEAEGLAEEYPCAVTLFDELSWQQRLALLARVAKALLDPNVRDPELSAVNEAAVAALYAHIDRNLTIELDYARETVLPEGYDKYFWRRLLAACQGEPNEEYYVEWNSADAGDWDVLIESLQDQILWDADWDMPELFMDVDPALSEGRKDTLGINDDYFADVAPDLRDSDVPAAFSVLEKLVRNG